MALSAPFRPKIGNRISRPQTTAFVKADLNPASRALDNRTPASKCCPRLARTYSGLVSVKPGNLARLIDKEAIMAKRPVKTAPRTRSAKTTGVKPTPTAETEVSKQSTVLAMLRRQNGASIAEIIEATGWQPHSVRGFFSGALKKRLKIDVVSEKNANTGERRYHVAALKA